MVVTEGLNDGALNCKAPSSRLFRRMSVIPYGRMQYVEVTAGPFERAFGLATVQMHTAAAASDARIPG
jgi:membrane protein YdbS with pleckstrin-like domain